MIVAIVIAIIFVHRHRCEDSACRRGDRADFWDIGDAKNKTCQRHLREAIFDCNIIILINNVITLLGIIVIIIMSKMILEGSQ